MLEKKLVPKLRFAELDGGWTNKRLSDVGAIITGNTPSTFIPEYYQNGTIHFVSPVDIQSNRYITNTKTTLSDLGFSKTRHIKKNSVLFVCIGSTIGKIAQASENCATNQQINAIQCNGNNLDSFLYSLLELKGNRIKLLAGNQAVPLINKKEFSKFKFYFPQLPEQQKIASFLTEVDTKLSQLSKKKALLENYKKGVMQKIFSQELRFKDDDGNDYGDWEEKKLGEVGRIVTGKTPSTTDKELWNGNIQFVTPTDINEDSKYQIETKRTVQNIGKLKLLPEKSIMYTCIASIGKMALSVQPCITNQQINSLIPNKEFDNEFIYYVLLKMTPKIKSSQTNTTLPIINKTEFSKFKIPYPCLEEQTKIANFFSELDTKIEVLSTSIENTQTFKKGLLQQLFV
jgi:type I restriction enzyme S subunit